MSSKSSNVFVSILPAYGLSLLNTGPSADTMTISVLSDTVWLRSLLMGVEKSMLLRTH